MNVVKCLNGHFYDADKYQLCPHCGAVVGSGEQSALDQSDPDQDQKKPRGLFKKKKEKAHEEVDVLSIPDKTMGKTFGIFDVDKSKQDEQIYVGSGPISEGSSIDDRSVNDAKLPSETVDQAVDIAGSKLQSDGQDPLDISSDEGEKSMSLREAVRSVSAGNGEKTVGFFSAGSHSISEINEPVVGWLVCVKGKHFGESFNIYAGRNSIGRSNGNKIVLAKENSVSREKHAWITYEPKKREFFLQPGESGGLSYVNGNNVMMPEKLQIYDQLEFGKGVFLLIPLCGENFTWEEYMDKE